MLSFELADFVEYTINQKEKCEEEGGNIITAISEKINELIEEETILEAEVQQDDEQFYVLGVEFDYSRDEDLKDVHLVFDENRKLISIEIST